MKKLYIAFGFATLFASCKPDIHSNAPDANDLNFSNYIAVGNSLTSGYANGTLYRSGQLNSYPKILADQFSVFGKIDFRQPLVKTETGFPSPKLQLQYTGNCAGQTVVAALPVSDTVLNPEDAMNIANQGPFNNFGIPYMRVVDFVRPGYADLAATLFNLPFAKRMFEFPTSSRPLDELRRSTPTFFTLWLGGNDVLGYALGGGQGYPALPEHPYNISDLSQFKAAYDSILFTLTMGGAKGVILSVPDITSIPFFTTIPTDGLVLDTLEAASLNAFYADSTMKFHTGRNRFVIQDNSVSGGYRQIKEGELVLMSLPSDSVTCGQWGSVVPLPPNYVLTLDELNNIEGAVAAFNAYINSRAVELKLPVLNTTVFMDQLESGFQYSGIHYTAEFVSGGVFSLDGIHLTPRGNALLANEIIRTINLYYKSSIPVTDPGAYDGMHFP